MVLAFAQVAESADSYDSATIALFVLFIVSIVVTSGFLLREIMLPPADTPDELANWPAHEPLQGEPHPQATAQPFPEWQRSAGSQPDRSHPGTPPVWFSQAVSSQRTGVAQGISRTVDQLIAASNRGDLRAGFACYTPEHLARHQIELGIDAGELERLARLEPAPAVHPISVSSLRDVTVDPPYRASAVVEYAGGDESHRPPERFRFLYDRASESWLIDGIEVLTE